MNHLRRNNRQRLDEEPIVQSQYSINDDDGGGGGAGASGGASDFEDRLDVPLIEGKEVCLIFCRVEFPPSCGHIQFAFVTI